MEIGTFSKCIKLLITSSDKVSVPGLGIFYAEPVPAGFSDSLTAILPPTRKMYFEKVEVPVEEGALLYDCICKMVEVSRDQAEVELEWCLSRFRSELDGNKVCVLPGLGIMKSTSDLDYYFVPDEDLDICPDSFALGPVPVKAEEPEPEAAPEPEPDVIPELAPEQEIEVEIEMEPEPEPVAASEPTPDRVRLEHRILPPRHDLAAGATSGFAARHNLGAKKPVFGVRQSKPEKVDKAAVLEEARKERIPSFRKKEKKFKWPKISLPKPRQPKRDKPRQDKPKQAPGEPFKLGKKAIVLIAIAAAIVLIILLSLLFPDVLSGICSWLDGLMDNILYNAEERELLGIH